MTLYTLRHEQTIQRPLVEVFSFFENPANLSRLTPGSLGFEFLTPQPIQMREGAVFDYVIRLLGLPVRWTTLIVAYTPPHSFVDLQLKGPYAYWHHMHQFKETPGGTMMTDEVRYAMPYGLVGALAHRLFVRSRLDSIFEYRSSVMAECFVTPVHS